jgi:hypothetical protein
MKSIIGRVAVLVIGMLVAFPALAVNTIPVRGSSGNGENSSAQFWALFGPTGKANITKGTTKVTYQEQVVCANQEVTNAVNPTDEFDNGACEDGAYLFIFQLQSTATNVTVELSGISGFTPDATSPNYGVMLCDSSENILELCTTGTQAELPAITFSTNATNTTATFVIPSFPSFPKGKGHEGQGVTLFIITQQSDPHPISLPHISLQ